jgi:hypothetical protein
MTIIALDRAKSLRKAGEHLGRNGMSQRVIAAVAEFDGSYKGAMVLAGRLKAVSQMATCDDYWREQVDKGFVQELRAPFSPRTPQPNPDGGSE